MFPASIFAQGIHTLPSFHSVSSSTIFGLMRFLRYPTCCSVLFNLKITKTFIMSSSFLLFDRFCCVLKGAAIGFGVQPSFVRHNLRRSPGNGWIKNIRTLSIPTRCASFALVNILWLRTHLALPLHHHHETFPLHSTSFLRTTSLLQCRKGSQISLRCTSN